MARFKTWPQLKLRKFKVTNEVSIHIGIEGNWLALPPSTLHKLMELSDMLERLEFAIPNTAVIKEEEKTQ